MSQQRNSSVMTQPVATSSSTTSWIITVGGTTAFVVASAAWMVHSKKKSNKNLSSWFTRNSASSSSLSSSKSYYLDYNGTTPIYKEVYDAMTPYLKEHFGNPSSSHLFGTEPRKAIHTARTQILQQLLGVTTIADNEDNNSDTASSSSSSSSSSSLDLSAIWFTGCGTESDNLAIKLALLSSPSSHSEKKKNPQQQRRQHIVTCNVEHPAIEMYLQYLEKKDNIDHNIDVTRVPVDTEGIVSADDVIKAITSDTVLVTLMLANNESGALQPVKQVAEECRRRGILFHTDAAVRQRADY
jgi:cysteine desulfurase